MPFTAVIRNAMLNSIVGIPAAVQATYASLHSDIPDDTGSDEISGGSPSYARQPISFQASTDSALLKDPSPTVVFDVPGGSTVQFVGLWTAGSGGTFLGYAPLSSDAAQVGVASQPSGNIGAPGHGLNLNDRVLIAPFSGLSLPTGFSPGVYFAAPVDGDNFKLAATNGGSAVTISTNGVVVFQKIRIDTFSGQGTVTVDSLTLGLGG